MRTLFALAIVFVLYAVGSLALAQTAIPDPVAPAIVQPTAEPIQQSTAVPVIRAQAVQSDNAADVLWGMTIEQLATFVFSVAGTLFVIIMTVWGLTQGKSLAETNAKLTAILEERSRNVESIAPLEQLYEKSVPESRRETILDAVEAVERLARLAPGSAASAGVGFVKEIVDGEPVADKLKQAEERIAKLEEQAASAESSFGGYTVTMDSSDAE